MTTYVAQRSEDLNKKSQAASEHQHQTRSKKVTFEKEPEIEKTRGEKSQKKPERQQESRVEEVDETDVEPVEEVPTGQKRRELPYVEVPPLKPVARAAMQTAQETVHGKPPQAYKSRAPVEEEVDIEKLVEQVLDIEVNVPLRSLAGASTAVREEIRKQVTRVRKPAEKSTTPVINTDHPRSKKVRLQDLAAPVFMLTEDVSEKLPKGYLVADDPVLQYLRENKGKEGEDLGVAVAAESEPLRAIYSVINRTGQEECLLDNGSQIVSMAKEVAVTLGLTWDPKIRINMESASGHVDRTLGLARNVVFRIGHLDIALQVHILEDPPYRVLLGRPFDTFASSKIDNSSDGNTVITLTDPNTKDTCVIPMYKRGESPDELSRSKQLPF